jgi:hypothetical protein
LSPTLREEHRLRVFENRVLKRIFGSKTDNVTRKWRKFHSEEIPNFHFSPEIWMMKSRGIRWAGHVACMARF